MNEKQNLQRSNKKLVELLASVEIVTAHCKRSRMSHEQKDGVLLLIMSLAAERHEWDTPEIPREVGSENAVPF